MSGGLWKPFLLHCWSQDLWSLPTSISFLTLHFLPSTMRWGEPTAFADRPLIASIMSWAVGNRAFGSYAIALVTMSESSCVTPGSTSRGDRMSSPPPCGGGLIDALGSCAVRRKNRTARAPDAAVGGG